MLNFRRFITCLVIALVCLAAAPSLAEDQGPLTIYSGRNESLIGPILAQFSADTGIEVEVLYGGTSAVANQILTEGENSPADVFIAQDGGALGALAAADMLHKLPDATIGRVVNPAFVSPTGYWVGLSGRARVFVYNPEMLAKAGLELPESILDLTDEAWSGLVGWAPTNASFVANVTAMRVLLGAEETAAWLAGMTANGVIPYPKNTPIVQATIDGEVVGGLVNHYYLFRFLAEDPDITARLHFFPGGDLGSLINVAGAAVLNTTDQPYDALALVDYLLSDAAQEYFAQSAYEYPLVDSVEPVVDLPALADIETPALDLSDLADLQGTLAMIEDSGALD
ncbi:MAG: iron ABC transporter substrate-binding protein [Chloroflexi bacterium]|nr:iron ABC transporter substrate-binding protein [Chloroflexota bacterium]MCY3581303.1 iron ABC transporter substrate-binding protein [Chloroflexota bacterium]MCY3716707.1 iron ABC transporter substrate-binding protein [Chloroflexota bacterium]MDE2649345.1 iron ABC transporter substrate-binding protein [Chloroflexota bacterium]MXX49678.1 iron ABC transporter substrate-binding protein [Chloroflexota bacterium]